MNYNNSIIGIEEWIAIPNIGIPYIKAKIDSGADISSIHAFNISITSGVNGKEDMARFCVNPIQGNRIINVQCLAPVIDSKLFRSSNGIAEMRYIIEIYINIGSMQKRIRLSLASRESMGYRMILGRNAIPHGLLIDANKGFILSRNEEKSIIQRYASINNGKVAKKNNSLNIAVLASSEKLYSNQRLMEEGRKRGYNMTFLNVRHCYFKVSNNGAEIYRRGGKKIEQLDAIIPRFKPSTSFYGCVLLRQFQASNTFCLNSPNAIGDARDKLRCLQLLAMKGISVPKTGFAHSIKDIKHLIAMQESDTMVLKLLEGTHGKGVILLNNKQTIENVMTAFEKSNTHVLLQEFIEGANGSDIRCFVVDGKIVASMKRIAANGEFRSNLHLGGTAHEVELTSEEQRLATGAAKIIGLDVAGVDIIRSRSGSFVIEVNSSPGLQGIEKVSKTNIAKKIFDCIHKNIYG